MPYTPNTWQIIIGSLPQLNEHIMIIYIRGKDFRHYLYFRDMVLFLYQEQTLSEISLDKRGIRLIYFVFVHICEAISHKVSQYISEVTTMSWLKVFSSNIPKKILSFTSELMHSRAWHCDKYQSWCNFLWDLCSWKETFIEIIVRSF